MSCLFGATYVMEGEILRGGEPGSSGVDVSEQGKWVYTNDPDTNELITTWVPLEDNGEVYKFDLKAEAIVDGGIRVSGTTERFGERYYNVEYIKIKFPPDVILTKGDRVTNIRSKQTGKLLWVDEELDAENGEFKATVFNVNGVSPLVDPFGRHVENFAMLERSN